MTSILLPCLAVAPAAAQPSPSKPTPTAGGSATTGSTVDPKDPAAGEDDTLYRCKKSTGMVTVSLKPETELKDLITWVMGFTCKNFVYDAAIMQRTKKITIISPNKMSPPDAYRLFLVAMSTMGVTVVPKGNSLRIVESGTAKGETLSIVRHGAPADSDEMVRAIIRPSYMTADNLNNALAVVKSKDGDIKQVGSALIVTDYGSAIHDMLALAHDLDIPAANDGIYTIGVLHADAKEMQTKLSEILGITANGAAPASDKGGKGAPPPSSKTNVESSSDVSAAVPSKILVDERSNTLIVVSNEAGYLRVRGLVKRLDIALASEANGSIHVYALDNANAEELANTLNAALQGAKKPGSSTPGAGGGSGAAARAAANAAPTDSLGATLEGTVRVTHDAPTNSLIIVSSGRDFLAVSKVVEQLDMPRRQVDIEGVILEIQLSQDFQGGVSSHGGIPVNGTDLALGGVQTGSLSSLNLSSLISATGLIGGLIGAPLPNSTTLLGASIPSYGVLFQALATNGNTNILSSPHIMAMDNEEAVISVGTNIPYKGSSFAGIGLGTAGGTGTSSLGGIGQNIQRQPLKLEMKIKPHISGSDNVRMEIEITIQDVGDPDPQLGPIWTDRHAKTKVVVHDQQSTVIGGLISSRMIFSETKVPLLGDIPILGYLFKYKQKQTRKNDLLILLTPYIVKDQLDIDQILQRKTRDQTEFARAMNDLGLARYISQIDYTRKRGLLEDINRTVMSIEEERTAQEALTKHDIMPEGAVEYDVHPDTRGEEKPTTTPTVDPGGLPPGTAVVPVEPGKDAAPAKKSKTKKKASN